MLTVYLAHKFLLILFLGILLLFTPLEKLENVYFLITILVCAGAIFLVAIDYIIWKFLLQPKKDTIPFFAYKELVLISIAVIILLLVIAIFRFYKFFHGC
jgi:hypothetical protein